MPQCRSKPHYLAAHLYVSRTLPRRQPPPPFPARCLPLYVLLRSNSHVATAVDGTFRTGGAVRARERGALERAVRGCFSLAHGCASQACTVGISVHERTVFDIGPLPLPAVSLRSGQDTARALGRDGPAPARSLCDEASVAEPHIGSAVSVVALQVVPPRLSMF